MASNPLLQLSKLGQSPWYHQMTRSLVTEGTPKNMIEEDGLRGLTLDPTIFEKAISGSKDYEDALRELVGKSVDVKFTMRWWWGDIASAADVFRPVYEAQGRQRRVRQHRSVSAARAGHGRHREGGPALARQVGPRLNVMIKVPATPEGLPAFEELISEGVSVNVTLIFSVEVYKPVVEDGEGAGDDSGGRSRGAAAGGNNFDQRSPEPEHAAASTPISDEDIPF